MTPGQAQPVHPGVLLRNELVGRGMTQLALAETMGRAPQLVSEIVNGKKSITPDTAIDLEEALGVDAGFWLRVQAAYELARARGRREKRDSLTCEKSPSASGDPRGPEGKTRWNR